LYDFRFCFVLVAHFSRNWNGTQFKFASKMNAF
jgi:hypothetical protein